MKYNAACVQPVCYLLNEDSVQEQQMGLQDLQVKLDLLQQ
jgi:hypothetical protein